MKNVNEVWKEILKLLEAALTGTSYRTWFLPLTPVKLDQELKILYLVTHNSFALDVITTRYMENLQQQAEIVLGEPYKIVVEFQSGESGNAGNEGTSENPRDEAAGKDAKETHPEKKRNAENAETEKQQQPLRDEVYFNPRYSFENFVVGNNNNYAYAASIAVAKTPSQAYNPLFIYGGSGLGKTHLMHAIGHYILDNHPSMKVLYVSSEMFTNELVKSLEDKNKMRMSAFKQKYRNVDVFLIDDIQFIEGKEATQEEFFHTFNALYDLNKQIIISSDRAPNKLTKLDDRLTSRFQWNMIADIQPPDYETRVAILRRKAELENLELDKDLEEVLNLIAEKIKFNVRELEGALSRLIGFSAIMHEKITVKFVRSTLKDIVPASDFTVSCESIKKTVCKSFNIKISDIESAKRTRNLAFPRQIAMYLCREMTTASLPKIGETFGDRDHTTVMHACDKISSEIKSNQATAEIVQRLKDEINGN